MVVKAGWVMILILVAGCAGPQEDVDRDVRNADGLRAPEGPSGAQGEAPGALPDGGQTASQNGTRQGTSQGTSSQNRTLQNNTSPNGTQTASHGTPVPWRSLARGVWSSHQVPDRRLEVAATDADWQALWDRHQAGQEPPEPRPSVDMNTEVVVVLLLGTHDRTGHEVEVTDVRWDGPDWEVHFEETDRGGQGCFTGQAQTDPYHFIAVERSGPLPAMSMWLDALVVHDCP